MKNVVFIIIIVLGLYALMKKFADEYKEIEKRGTLSEQTSSKPAPPQPASNLPGLPPTLEAPLQAAEKQGAEGLKFFLNKYRYAIQDPRLASIELDYVVLISLRDPAEAKGVFKAVQQRTPTWSPIYERVKSLAKNYQ